MNGEVTFPKRLIRYVNETGVRALDRLAERAEAPSDARKGTAHQVALAGLVDNWKAMSGEEKERFVGEVTTFVVDAIVASAVLPKSVRLSKKALKKTKKVIEKRMKSLRKASKPKARAKPAAAKKRAPTKKK